MQNLIKFVVDKYPYGVYYLTAAKEEGNCGIKCRKEEEAMDESKKEKMTKENDPPCCCMRSAKTKERPEKEYRDLMNRLKRIEGQVRGIQNMLETDAYCADILVQVAAVNAALNSFNKVLMADHVRTCVAENIRQGNDEVIDELVGLLQKLMR